MPVVKKITSSSSVVKKSRTTPKVQSFRSPSSILEMGDTSLGTLDASKDGFLLSFDSASDKFVLTNPNEQLESAANTGDINDQFIDQLEQELDFGQIQAGDIDGGGF